jgi:hypothetical protein
MRVIIKVSIKITIEKYLLPFENNCDMIARREKRYTVFIPVR